MSVTRTPRRNARNHFTRRPAVEALTIVAAVEGLVVLCIFASFAAIVLGIIP